MNEVRDYDLFLSVLHQRAIESRDERPKFVQASLLHGIVQCGLREDPFIIFDLERLAPLD